MNDDSLKSKEVSASHGLRTGLTAEDIKQAFLDNLFYLLGRTPAIAAKNDLYTALAVTVRDRVFRASVNTYVDCQNAVGALWNDPIAWSRRSILNVARMGKFSSDRSIRDYCERVWNVTAKPVPVN